MLQGTTCERLGKHPDMASGELDALQKDGRVQEERGDRMSNEDILWYIAFALIGIIGFLLLVIAARG